MFKEKTIFSMQFEKGRVVEDALIVNGGFSCGKKFGENFIKGCLEEKCDSS